MNILGRFLPIVFASVLLIACSPGLRAADGTYNNATTGGLWSDSLNWSGGTIADGADFTASFIADLTTANTVTLDTSRTIGNLSFTDSTSPGTANIWTLAPSGGSVLTLATTSGTPTITVNNSAFASAISAPLVGNQGFTKAGAGNLIFKDTSTASNQISGEIHLTAGKLNLQNISGGDLTLTRMVNAAVNFDSGTALTVGNSGGAGAGMAGLISTGANGTVNATSNLRTLSLGGSGTYSFGGTLSANSSSNTFLLNVNMTNGGSQTLTNTANTYRGLNNINSGSLISASATLTGTPFAIGGVTLSNSGVGAGAISIAPTAGSGDVAYTGASIDTAVNNVVVATFTYGNGAQLLLDKGSANSLTYTVGAAAAPANSILIRSAAAAANNASNQGTLILGAASGTAALGTATGEKFIVNGGVPTINGIASASIIGRDGSGAKSGTFLGYDATNGFQQATYSVSTDINGGTAFADTRVFDATASTTNVLTADSSVYALRTSGQTVSGAFTLSVGDSTAGTAGGVILNGGAIDTSGLAFSTDAAGVIYTSAANGSISAAITNIASGNVGRGVTFEGPGVLTLSGVNTFRGGAFINDSTVAISNNNQLGTVLSGVTGAGSLTLRGGTLQSAADGVAITGRAITLNPGVSGGGGTFDVTTGTTTITNSSSSGKIISGTGTLTKTGTGTLALGGNTANTYTGKTLVSAGTLLLNTSAGGAAISSRGATGYSAAATDIQVTGGTLQLGAADQIFDTAKLALSGGTFDLNGNSEGTAGTAGLGNFTLSLTSTIDFGAGDNGNILQFAGVDTHAAGVLQIINWDGTANTGNGSERLLFMGTDVTAFTGLFTQSDVSFNGTLGYNAVQFGSYYEITAVPEPSTVALLIGAAGSFCLWARRRRSL